jgi:putative photosynthetic complex assembly protein
MLEHDYEPVPGLPQELPRDERILWQGRPTASGLAKGTFHVRAVAVYFLILLAFSMVSRIAEGGLAIWAAMSDSLGLMILAAVALGLLAGYARLVAKTSLISITTKRIIVRTGIAVPVTINLPFSRVDSVDLRVRQDGNGDISVLMERGSRASYALLWPFVRPFRVLRVQPVLRGVDGAEATARLLADALVAYTDAGPEHAVGEDTARPVEAPKSRDSWADRRRRWLSYPTLPLAAATSLVVVSLVAVGWVRAIGYEQPATQADSVLSTAALYFEDRDDGSVVVIDADSDRTLDVLAPGTNGFIRGTLRSLARARRAVDAGSEQPFTLMRTDSGQLLLSDSVSGREIDLWAFGSTNAEAFSRYLDPGTSESARSAINAPVSGSESDLTAVALTKQEPGQ